MRATEFEMPYLRTGRLNVPLQNDATNLQTLTQLQASNPITLETDTSGVLYFVPTSDGGQYAFVSTQKTPKIEYFMEFKEQALTGVLKHAATQIMIWNRLGPIGLTSRVFFDRMLHKYDTMISDDQQSVDGQRFWLRQLRESLKRGFMIGMLDGNQLHGYDPAGDFDTWIASLDAWGQNADHWFRRFFITKVSLPVGH
jgi:hypothetical protein